MGITIKSFVNAAKNLPPNISVLIQGDHGIGKSEVAKQLAKHFNIPMIDIRLGQKEVGDITGLPIMNEKAGTTTWLPPDWFKQACVSPHFLFFDEMNRATLEVLQATFEIVLDRRLGFYNILHPETRIYAAINTDNKYHVNELDPAKRDRFAIFDLTPDVKDWLQWASGPGNVHEDVVDFISINNNLLDYSGDYDATKKYQSRRSWDRLSQVLTKSGLITKPNTDEFFQISLSLVGLEAATSFTDFVKNRDREVTIEEVLTSWPKAKKRLGDSVPMAIYVNLASKLPDYLKQMSEVPSNHQLENLKLFVDDSSPEIFMTVFQMFNDFVSEKLAESNIDVDNSDEISNNPYTKLLESWSEKILPRMSELLQKNNEDMAVVHEQ